MQEILILSGTGQVVAAATSASVEINQAAEKYDLLPDMANETTEQWEYYKPGDKSWAVKHQGFYVAEMGNGWATSMVRNQDTSFKAKISLSPSIFLAGAVHLQDVSIDAPHNALAKFNASLIGDNLPQIE